MVTLGTKMNKLIVTIVSVGILGFALVGCGSKDTTPATAEGIKEVPDAQKVPADKKNKGGAAIPDFGIDGQGGTTK